MSVPKHRLLAVAVCLFTAALMFASLAASHPLDATDLDHDGYKNFADNCPNNYNPKQQDTDGDMPKPVYEHPEPAPSVGPVIVYPTTPATPQDPPVELPTDVPPDKGGDACDNDDDGDGITDNPKRDNCKLVANEDQTDSDFDGLGDACDDDDDNDDVRDAQDNCPLASNAGQVDFDKDGKGDSCDPDGPKAKTTGLAGSDPNDKKAPKVAVVTRTVIRFEELGRGLAVAVRCNEGCSLDGSLVVDRRTARRLKLAGRKSTALARGAAQIEAKGNTWVFLKFSKATMRRMVRSGRITATFRLVAKDANGNRALASKRIKLRR